MTLEEVMKAVDLAPGSYHDAEERLRRAADSHAPDGNIGPALARALAIYHIVPYSREPGWPVDVDALYQRLYHGRRTAAWLNKHAPRQALLAELPVRPEDRKPGRPAMRLLTTFEGLLEILDTIDHKRITAFLGSRHNVPETFYLDWLEPKERPQPKCRFPVAMIDRNGIVEPCVALRDLHTAARFSTQYSTWSTRKLQQYDQMPSRDYVCMLAKEWQRKLGEPMTASSLQYEHIIPLRLAILMCDSHTMGPHRNEIKRELMALEASQHEN